MARSPKPAPACLPRRVKVKKHIVSPGHAEVKKNIVSPGCVKVKKDSAFLNREPLWQTFRACEARARARNKKRRQKSFVRLEGLEFSHAARAKIDPATLARIKSVCHVPFRLPTACDEALMLSLLFHRSRWHVETRSHLLFGYAELSHETSVALSAFL